MSKLLLSFLLVGIVLSCQKNQSTIDGSEDAKIISAIRALSNKAIADHDTLRISDPWMNDFLLITSTNLRVDGKEENRRLFAQHFKEKPEVIYIRTPDKIEVMKDWNMASENGAWEGSWTEGINKIEIGGTYYAKWHNVDGEWLLRAEIYTPTHCKGGPYCTIAP